MELKEVEKDLGVQFPELLHYISKDKIENEENVNRKAGFNEKLNFLNNSQTTDSNRTIVLYSEMDKELRK